MKPQKKAKKAASPRLSREILVPGADYLAAHPDFRLVGRDGELEAISNILMRRDARSLIMTGASGVGTTSLIMGIEESKQNPATPYDIAGKKFYWLDTDALFSSSDVNVVQGNFQKVLDTLAQNSDSVLVVQNAGEFIEAARRRNCPHFINALMGDLWNNKFQAILECRDNQLADILGSHPYIRQIFTVREITEPEKSQLNPIVTAAAGRLEQFHGIRISPEAVSAAIRLMEQFHIPQIEHAQPGRTLALLDSALTSFRHLAHAHGPDTDAVSLAGGASGAFGKGAANHRYEWSDLHRRIREVQKEQQETEAKLNGLGLGDDAAAPELRKKLQRHRDEYRHLDKQINAQLMLTEKHVYAEFSRISHMPVDTIDNDETGRLLAMEDFLAAGVYGQDEPVKGVSGAVRSGRLGLKSPDEPIASFIFLGPSGTGKTALAERLARHLFRDEQALQRYDMSEFSGDDGVEKFIETVTENMRRRPYCVNIFDEMEKGNKKIFDLFLQINDKGRLTNSAGLVANFSNAINIVTSNIGQDYFYDEKLTFAEASRRAKDDLADVNKSGYRNEVLNRFTGIFSFKTLEQAQLIMVAKRQMKEIGRRVEEKGVTLAMPPDADIDALCNDHYVRRKGARSIQKYLRENIAGDISLILLQNKGVQGTIRTAYDSAAKKLRTVFEPLPGAPAAPPKPKPPAPQPAA